MHCLVSFQGFAFAKLCVASQLLEALLCSVLCFFCFKKKSCWNNVTKKKILFFLFLSFALPPKGVNRLPLLTSPSAMYGNALPWHRLLTKWHHRRWCHFVRSWCHFVSRRQSIAPKFCEAKQSFALPRIRTEPFNGYAMLGGFAFAKLIIFCF